MTLDAVNRALRPHALVWRRLLLTLAAVVAIIVGLLAMHSFSTDAGNHDATTAVVAEAHQHEHGGAPFVANHDCDGACEPGHSMPVTACLLALLVFTLLLAAREAVARGRLPLPGAANPEWPVQAGALRWPRPPSLEALSISRT